MRYHNITTNDMLNGNGLRVVLWLSGCEHNCPGCHNPQTHSPSSGIFFDQAATDELMGYLSQPHIAGITFSGGDPLHRVNQKEVLHTIMHIKKRYPNKDIWLYTGHLYEDVKDLEIIKLIDVLVDGRYIEKLKSPDLPWVGSSNQRVLYLNKGEIINEKSND